MLLCFMLLFSAGASGKNVVTIVFKNGKQLASSFIANTSSTVKGLAAHVGKVGYGCAVLLLG